MSCCDLIDSPLCGSAPWFCAKSGNIKLLLIVHHRQPHCLLADSHHELYFVTNLEHLKVGAQALADGFMQHLPELPSSLLKLDLLGGGMTNLDQLTLLTRLKMLGMPSLPTTQQLSIIKRLCQLRHVYETKGMAPLACLHDIFLT